MSQEFARCKRIQSGFTLIEIAVVMLIFSLLAAGAVTALRAQAQRASFQDTQIALQDARDALLGFAASTGRLPCPADPTAAPGTPAEGVERAGGCAGATTGRGLLPWRTLGIQALDAWNQRLTYQVVPEFARAAPPLPLPTTPMTTLFARTDPPVGLTNPRIVDSSVTLNSVANASTVAFAVWSHGENGHFAVNAAGVHQPANSDAAAPFDETSNNPNIANPAPIVSRAASQLGSPLNEFDDTAIWVSKFTLFKLLLEAGYNIP